MKQEELNMEKQNNGTAFEDSRPPKSGKENNSEVFDISTREGTLNLMVDVKKLHDSFSEMYSRMEYLQTEIDKLSNYRSKKTIVFLILAIFFSIYTAVCVVAGATKGIVALEIGGFVTLPFYILFFYFNLKDKKIRKTNEETIKLNTSEINQISERIISEYYTFDISDYYPIDYFYDYAIITITQYLKQFRAESLKEALNLYETQAHQRRLEEQQRQSINIQKEILNKTKKAANAATAAAVFSGISAYNSMKTKKMLKVSIINYN